MSTHKFYPLVHSNRPGISILLADDDVDDQYLITQAVKEINRHHQVTSVLNGAELLEFFGEKTGLQVPSQIPDIILLDINMPLVDGFEVLLKLKADPKLKHIPTFVLSTSRSQKDRDRSVELGAQGFYTKPHQYGLLRNILGEICEQVSAAKNNLV